MSTSPRPARSPGRDLLAAWSTLVVAQRRVGAAAALVLVTFLLPWFSVSTVRQVPGSALARSGGSLSGLGAFSFVEGAVVVVTLALLALLWGRATGRRFSLPADDGQLVIAAGTWIGLLVVYRLFAKPHGETTPRVNTEIGWSWGILATLIAVGLLIAAGVDLHRRSAHGLRRPRPVPPGREPFPAADPATVAVAERAEREPGRSARPREDVSHARPSPGPPRPAGPDVPTTVSPADHPTTVVPDDHPTTVSPVDDATAVRPPTDVGERGQDWPSRMARRYGPPPRNR